MKRSAGVVVVAVLSLLGSLLTFAMGVLMLVMMVFVPTLPSQQFPVSPTMYRVLFSMISLMYLLPGAWGVATAIGLWKLRNWARISTIVFAIILIVMGGFVGLFTLVMPFPTVPNAGADPSMISTIKFVMGCFWLALLGIGVWWLVFFTRATVKAQFGQYASSLSAASSLQGDASGPAILPPASSVKRPLSITIIAWLLLIGCVFMPLALVFRAPAVLFTSLLTGWQAAIVYMSFFSAQLVIGIGLLRLRPAARTGGIVYFIFGVINMAVFYLAPGSHARVLALLESEQSMFPWMRPLQGQPQFHVDYIPSLMLGSTMGVLFMLVQIYFLIASRRSFGNSPAAGSAVSTL